MIKLKLYNLKESAYDQYRQTVRGNETISFEQAQKKLTRNIHLGVERKSFWNTLRLQHEYIYGYLKIITRFGKIVGIENKTKDAIPGWSVDRQEYILVSKELGIVDDKFSHR